MQQGERIYVLLNLTTPVEPLHFALKIASPLHNFELVASTGQKLFVTNGML
jgi:hypothetical protein